jgi:hypothetical protein
MVIASPGPTKRRTANELESLWLVAEEALRRAQAIVFVGYRFPPTDAQARERLLTAIAANTQNYLAVHIVLGPQIHSDDVIRLRRLLDYSLFGAVLGPRRRRLLAGKDASDASKSSSPTGNVVVQPLFAQDFFSVFQHDHVTAPAHFLRDEDLD